MQRHSPTAWLLFVATLVWAAGPAQPAAAGLPPEGTCPALSAAPGTEVPEDASPTLVREGMKLSISDLPALRELLPPEIWRYRDVFFYEGMRLEIGPCHRRYPVGTWYERATRAFAGRARVDEHGNLYDYVAGLPFPPDAIEPQAPDAGVRWAWNLEHRYRGAGPSGHFRITDIPDRLGAVEVFEGEFFALRTRHRADLAESGYALPESSSTLWVAGGRFSKPFSARHLAWRQLRPVRAETRYEQPDDTFVYVPTMRKVRRAATAWVDGIYTPRYLVSGDTGGGGVPFGSSGYGPTGSVQPNAGLSIAASEHTRKGFIGLSLRPNAYRWRLRGERDVLAPINGAVPGFPESETRNFGPSGLSVATDRWEVRRAVLIEGQALRPEGLAARVVVYIDYQTQQPLYWFVRTRERRLLDVGILVHRFSGDDSRYPRWPDGSPANVFDPVAAVFLDATNGRSGWRRESYDVRSVPPDPDRTRALVSTDSLAHGH